MIIHIGIDWIYYLICINILFFYFITAVLTQDNTTVTDAPPTPTTAVPTTPSPTTTEPPPPPTTVAPTPSPVPYPAPSIGKWFYEDANTKLVCVIAQFALQFNISYKTTGMK